MEKQNLDKIFNLLKKILKKYEKDRIVGSEKIIGSRAKGNKKGFHLYGKREVSVIGRKPQQTYVSGIILHKDFVGFYSMPVYSHPKFIKKINPNTQRMLKGKSCFNIKELKTTTLKDIELLIKEGIQQYEKEGWI